VGRGVALSEPWLDRELGSSDASAVLNVGLGLGRGSSPIPKPSSYAHDAPLGLGCPQDRPRPLTSPYIPLHPLTAPCIPLRQASAVLKIGLGLGQCLSTLRSFSRVRWPETFTSFIDAIDQFTVEAFAVVPVECVAGRYMHARTHMHARKHTHAHTRARAHTQIALSPGYAPTRLNTITKSRDERRAAASASTLSCPPARYTPLPRTPPHRCVAGRRLGFYYELVATLLLPVGSCAA